MVQDLAACLLAVINKAALLHHIPTSKQFKKMPLDPIDVPIITVKFSDQPVGVISRTPCKPHYFSEGMQCTCVGNM